MMQPQGSQETISFAGQTNEAVSNLVQLAIGAAKQKDPKNVGTSDFVYIGCMAALGALQMVAGFVAERPNLSKQEVDERGTAEVVKLINSDTLLLTALIAAKIQSDIKLQDESAGAVAVTANYGPSVIWAALQDWEKITGKSPDGIFDLKMIEAAREAGREKSLSFDEFNRDGFQVVPMSRARH